MSAADFPAQSGQQLIFEDVTTNRLQPTNGGNMQKLPYNQALPIKKMI